MDACKQFDFESHIEHISMAHFSLFAAFPKHIYGFSFSLRRQKLNYALNPLRRRCCFTLLFRVLFPLAFQTSSHFGIIHNITKLARIQIPNTIKCNIYFCRIEISLNWIYERRFRVVIFLLYSNWLLFGAIRFKPLIYRNQFFFVSDSLRSNHFI